MNANQLINMIVRMALRPLINRGINRMSKGRIDEGASPEVQAAQKKNAAETAKRARQAARITRKMGRF